MGQSVKPAKKLLVCITGLTPQVVTETLYALRQEGDLPTHIKLITTANGRNRCQRDLLDPRDGRFLQFCKEFGIEGSIAFSESDILVIHDKNGKELTDIRTPAENVCAADTIMSAIRDFCKDPYASVHLSIAGGRKSMGFLAGYALSIFGRQGDRLTHVLTNEPFENNRDFYYPSKFSKPLFAADGSPLDMAKAEISLADIPFIRLRSGLTQTLLNGSAGFSDTVRLAQQSIAPDPSLQLFAEGTKPRAVLGGARVKLSLKPFTVYYWFAKRRREGLPAVNLTDDESLLEDFLSCARRLLGRDSAAFVKIEETIRSAEDLKDCIRTNRSRINSSILSVLGETRADPYLITSNRKRLRILYDLTIKPDAISLQ